MFHSTDTQVMDLQLPPRIMRDYTLLTPGNAYQFSADNLDDRNLFIVKVAGVKDFMNEPWAIAYASEGGAIHVAGTDKKLRKQLLESMQEQPKMMAC
ncbi:hypothetical protein CYG49_03070 [Candidatus Saccharibacteria bacterium]|nr:MAG: hypothetical protein CYG49_03070 [Candidatus Saccharibacteria bacterium]